MKKDNASWNGSLLFLVAENLDGRKKFHQWLKKSGYAIEFKKAYDSELSQWLQYMSKKLGITLDREATDLLLIASDGSLQRLEQELQKAWLYSGAEAKTELKQIHVSQVASSHVTHEMIEFVEAVLQKKKTKSLLFVDKLIQTSEDALGLVGFLVWALKNPSRTQSSQNKKSVARMLEQLIELDYKLKRSGMDAKLLVENFILKVCG